MEQRSWWQRLKDANNPAWGPPCAQCGHRLVLRQRQYVRRYPRRNIYASLQEPYCWYCEEWKGLPAYLMDVNPKWEVVLDPEPKHRKIRIKEDSDGRTSGP